MVHLMSAIYIYMPIDKLLLIVIYCNYPKWIIFYEMLHDFLIFIPHATQINYFIAFLLIIYMYCLLVDFLHVTHY